MKVSTKLSLQTISRGARGALAQGANPNARIGRNNILRDAISHAGLPMMKFLVDAGADPLAGSNNFGAWIVPYSMCAEQYGTPDMAEFFRMIEQRSPDDLAGLH